MNAKIKSHCAKAFALHSDDVLTHDEFERLLKTELKRVAKDLKYTRLLFANLAELQKAAGLVQKD